MTHPPVKRCENKEKNIPDTWECRYFISELPQRFTHKELNRFFDKWYGPTTENDLYFITDDPKVNIKLRKLKELKTNIKFRIRRDKREEFELWHTEIDNKLPAPTEVWNKVLAKLKVKGDIELLSKCSEPFQVKQALLTAKPNLLHREIWKHRTRYIRPQGEVEVAEITIGTSFFYSVSFESKSVDPDQVLAIRDELSADGLGIPKSYTKFLLQISLS